MIEKTVIDWLKAKNITSIGNNVYAETPKKNIPSNYVVVEKTGEYETESGHMCVAMIAVQSRSAETLYKAATINEAVKEKMKLLADEDSVNEVSLNNDYNFSNPETKEYRYQAVFNINYNSQ